MTAGADYWRRGKTPRGFERKLIVKRDPKLLGDGELKVRRHHTNDGGGFAINSDALPDDIGIGVEIALPDFVTQNRRLFRAGLVVLGREIAAHDRRHANDLEKVLRDITAGITLRIVFVGDVDGRSVEIAGHHAQMTAARRAGLRSPEPSECCQCRSYCFGRRLRIDQSHAHQLLRMRKRKSAQHESINQGELRGHAADAEGEHEHGEKTKGFFFEQNTQADADILTKRIENHNEFLLLFVNDPAIPQLNDAFAVGSGSFPNA